MKLARLIAIALMPLMLASCLYSPGKFSSAMLVKADGRFTFSYKGEIVFLSLYQLMSEKKFSGSDTAEKCWGPLPGEGADVTLDEGETAGVAPATHGAEYGMADRDAPISEIKPIDPSAPVITPDWNERDCTTKELEERAVQKKEREVRDREEAKKFEEILGFNPEDETSMQAFAAKMTKQKGYRSVVYRGKGIFEIDYEIAGTLDRDFVFPVMPDAAIVYPMVLTRKRADGSVQITAPAFANNANNPMAAMAVMGGMSTSAQQARNAGPSLVDGIFTITTDAPILTNNTEDGPAADGAVQKLVWPVNTTSAKIPETLLRLSQ